MSFDTLPEDILYRIFKGLDIKDRMSVWCAAPPHQKPRVDAILDKNLLHLPSSITIDLTQTGNILNGGNRDQIVSQVKSIGKLLSDKRIDSLSLIYKSKTLDINHFWVAGQQFPHTKRLHLYDRDPRSKGKRKEIFEHLVNIETPMMPNLIELELSNVSLDKTTDYLISKLSGGTITKLVMNEYYLGRKKLAVIPHSVRSLELNHPTGSNFPAVKEMIQQNRNIRSIVIHTSNEFFEELFLHPLEYTVIVMHAQTHRTRSKSGIAEVQCQLTRTNAKANMLYDSYLIGRMNCLIASGKSDIMVEPLTDEEVPAAKFLWKRILRQERQKRMSAIEMRKIQRCLETIDIVYQNVIQSA